jgi:hypothetical protein
MKRHTQNKSNLFELTYCRGEWHETGSAVVMALNLRRLSCPPEQVKEPWLRWEAQASWHDPWSSGANEIKFLTPDSKSSIVLAVNMKSISRVATRMPQKTRRRRRRRRRRKGGRKEGKKERKKKGKKKGEDFGSKRPSKAIDTMFLRLWSSMSHCHFFPNWHTTSTILHLIFIYLYMNSLFYLTVYSPYVIRPVESQVSYTL